MDRTFEGIKNLYGLPGLEKIQNSHFLVVGIGGIGSWICESLVRSGALEITLVDLDDICISNTNRQIHTLHNNIGQMKIDAMKDRLLKINPNIQVHCILDFFSGSTKDSILNKNYDFVFDAIDSLKSKCLLLDECHKKKLPVICIGGAGGKTDPTQIEIRDLKNTISDQLLFRVRKALRKKEYSFSIYANKPFKVPTVFSKEVARKSVMEESELKNSNAPLNCESGFGSASFVTASMGFAAVSFALNTITDYETN
jgi:tRNA A37 threonylcarbamoyladenosine dehydratase